MEPPFFSIIIPTYNRAHLIEKTLDSVLQQSFNDYEIIIVDNNSTDNTAELLKKYVNNSKIKLYVQEQNYERSHSRNMGMMLAKGQYLTFLDSDDILYKNSLQAAHQYIIKHPDSDFLHHHYEISDITGKHLYSFAFPSSKKGLIKKLLAGNFLSCIGVFISRKIYTQYKFDENKAALGSEDWDFWIRIMSKYSLGIIPEVYAAIIQHDERTVTQNQSDKIIERKNYYLKKYRTTPELNNQLGQYLNIFEAGFYLYAATVSYQTRNFKAGYVNVLAAFSKNPSCVFTIVFWKIFLSPVKKSFLK